MAFESPFPFKPFYDSKIRSSKFSGCHSFATHQFVLSSLVKFTKAPLCDYSEHNHTGEESGKYRVGSKALANPHVNDKSDSECVFPNKQHH